MSSTEARRLHGIEECSSANLLPEPDWRQLARSHSINLLLDFWAKRNDLCLDLMLNHLSDHLSEFQDYIRHGGDSAYVSLFVDIDALGEISPDDLAKIHIRKEKEPFREVDFSGEGQGRVWCTFTEQQIDLDYRSPQTYKLMEENIAFLCTRGVKLVRLDAFGYTTSALEPIAF